MVENEYVPMSRFEAIQRGSKYYMAMRMCKIGHMGRRRADSGACVECYEMALKGNRIAAQAGQSAVNELRDALTRVRAEGGLARLAPFESVASDFAALIYERAATAEQLAAALANVPFQTPDGKLWMMTGLGRSIGRATVVEMMSKFPGDAMNTGWVEEL